MGGVYLLDDGLEHNLEDGVELVVGHQEVLHECEFQFGAVLVRLEDVGGGGDLVLLEVVLG